MSQQIEQSPESSPLDGPPARDRYIPIGKTELVDALIRRENIPAARAAALERLARWFSLFFHLDFFNRRETLKDLYTRFDPDQPGIGPLPPDTEGRARFFEEMESALTAANFRRLHDAELDPGDGQRGRVGARIEIPHQTYDEVRFYGRGRRIGRFTVRTFLGLRRETVEAPVYDHVVFCAAAAADPEIPAQLRGRLRPGGLYVTSSATSPKPISERSTPTPRS